MDKPELFERLRPFIPNPGTRLKVIDILLKELAKTANREPKLVKILVHRGLADVTELPPDIRVEVIDSQDEPPHNQRSIVTWSVINGKPQIIEGHWENAL